MNQAESNWGNGVWLTAHLQDLIMDKYQYFYENCTVTVKENWTACRNSIVACSLIQLDYAIEWPISIIITSRHMAMYKEAFHFIFLLKWSLYTTNHLSFTGKLRIRLRGRWKHCRNYQDDSNATLT